MTDLPDPTWRLLLSRGMPTFALEGVLPMLVFYAVLRASSLPAAIAASSVAGGAVVALHTGAAATSRWRRSPSCSSSCRPSSAWPRTAPRSIWPSRSCSAPAGGSRSSCRRRSQGRSSARSRKAWYPFPEEFRASRAYRREFGLQSVVWGAYCAAAAALRLGALLLGGVGGLVVVSLAAGTPAQVALVGWCLWHARQALTDDSGPRPPARRRPRADGNEAQMSSSVRL